MDISKEEIQRRLGIYRAAIPRLNWFDENEQIELLTQAWGSACRHDENFFSIAANLAHRQSIEKGKCSPVDKLNLANDFVKNSVANEKPLATEDLAGNFAWQDKEQKPSLKNTNASVQGRSLFS